MTTTARDVGQAMARQLYDAVCGESAMSKDSYLTWCAPGRVFAPSDFDVCVRGFGSGLDQDARQRLAGQAHAIAELVDGPARLSTVYADVLRRSLVVRGELSDEERLKVEKYRHLLRSTRKVTDLDTGEEREVTEDGPMLKAYRERQAAYLAAELGRNLARVDRPDPSTVDDHGALVGEAVGAAMDAWVANGYRDEVEQVIAYLAQVNRRDLVLWRRHLVELYDDALVTAAAGRFHHTTLVPADFATGSSWYDYTFDAGALDRQVRVRSASWRAGCGGTDFGLGTAAGSVSGVELSGFRVQFRLARVLISRPWFFPELLDDHGWTLPGGDLLSDGGDPPSGPLVGYPAAVLFADDLRITSPEFVAAYRNGATTWGPFRLDGATVDGGRLAVQGIQAIGFVNRQLGRTPDPSPELDRGRLG